MNPIKVSELKFNPKWRYITFSKKYGDIILHSNKPQYSQRQDYWIDPPFGFNELLSDIITNVEWDFNTTIVEIEDD